MTAPGDLRGRVMWLYCLTDGRRRIVKVGISSNVPRRACALSDDGKEFLRQWVGVSVPSRRTALPVVRTWALGPVSRSYALRVEQMAHNALREAAKCSCGEWFHLTPRVAVPLIERACGSHLTEAA